MARLSVYALECGGKEENTRFSQKYNSFFKEGNRGMVSFSGQTFENPIEHLRNHAMLEMTNMMKTKRLLQICNESREDFNRILAMSPSQMKTFVELSDQAQYDMIAEDGAASEDHQE